MTGAVAHGLWTAAEAAAVDRHSIDVVGMPSAILMERAALACSHEVVAMREGSSLPVVVVCGLGNNGADGYAVARQLHGWGLPVWVVDAGTGARAEAAAQRALAEACGVAALPLAALPAAAIVVDACLGTGSRGAPRGALAATLAALMPVAGPRLAIDVPSGVDPDTGAVHEHAIVATVTVTFGRSKPGLHVWPGRGHAGTIVVADIGLCTPAGLVPSWSLVDPEAARGLLRLPSGVRHKGDRGHVAVRGGGIDTPGAVILAVHAAFRAGAGLVTVLDDRAVIREAVIAAQPEAMLASPTADASAAVDADETRGDALVVGPGMTDAAARVGLAALWRDDPRPAVWDAGALTAIDGPCAARPRIITPHPGEAARMLARLDAAGWTAARVQADRGAAAMRLAALTDAVVLLKGAGTIIATMRPSAHAAIVTIGGAALATAGSGDVLAGILGALLARGVAPWDAAAAGAIGHAAAGDRAGQRHVGTTAGDLITAFDDVDDALAGTHGALPRQRRG